eukprot:CAMPEP_0113641114 /NCGR_PEP_ID=MMETSP0017_2-20120614/21582_1 /TAXON_ID=2856 /ORGANISM="Cylindrotheca closterium" /LENGTH=162 /DNA_ID=CAMNT_0000552437 /DNA_START=307 /DNA_END=795 /DNA_ORIENTATION=+ /assembly_acc=CAM_ASM_000147
MNPNHHRSNNNDSSSSITCTTSPTDRCTAAERSSILPPSPATTPSLLSLLSRGYEESSAAAAASPRTLPSLFSYNDNGDEHSSPSEEMDRQGICDILSSVLDIMEEDPFPSRTTATTIPFHEHQGISIFSDSPSSYHAPCSPFKKPTSIGSKNNKNHSRPRQ